MQALQLSVYALANAPQPDKSKKHMQVVHAMKIGSRSLAEELCLRVIH